MSIITINTYDPAGRFDMTDEEAEVFFQHVEKQAEKSGLDTRRVCNLSVDEESERFVESCFKNYQ